MKPLISHEIPADLFLYHDLINDYPYVLAHLLGKNKQYSDFYKEKLLTAEFSILDNSAFELGKPIDGKELIELTKEYQPTHIVIPDGLHNSEETQQLAKDFIGLFNREYNNTRYSEKLCEIKLIGVCQGENFEEALDCFKYFYESKSIVDIIAIPFDLFPNSDNVTDRFRFLQHIFYKVWNGNIRDVKIHLLGCKNPIEFALFKHTPIASCIKSIDTSSPIVNGFCGNTLNEHGLTQPKPKDKLADNIDRLLSKEDIKKITYNVSKFKEYVTW